jgi:Cys-tRNA(Pro)/Cys-tRNA(Cys) deacylase
MQDVSRQPDNPSYTIMAKKKRPLKNIVTRLLDGQKIVYETRTYDPDVFVSAPEVAAGIDMPARQVFKTLVALPDKGKPMLAVLPADAELDLKALARAAGAKKAHMASLARAEKMTGLRKGGISSLALIHRGFRVFLDESAREFDFIAMSAGVRGMQVILAPDDFIALTNAHVAPITRKI